MRGVPAESLMNHQPLHCCCEIYIFTLSNIACLADIVNVSFVHWVQIKIQQIEQQPLE